MRENKDRQENEMENTKGMEKDTVHQTDEIEIDLWEICLVLIHNLALIISVGIMAALVAFLATQLLACPNMNPPPRFIS